MLRSFPVKRRAYDVCRKGCQMFTDDDTLYCSCGESRFEEGSRKPKAQMQQLSICQQLTSLIAKDRIRDTLYHFKNISLVRHLCGLFDGESYQSLRKMIISFTVKTTSSFPCLSTGFRLSEEEAAP